MKHPNHTNANEIVAKIWLIGRSYAAAIERSKNIRSFSGDFYYDVVAPEILNIGGSLDKMLGGLKAPLDFKSINNVLDTHGFLTSKFEKMTKKNNRSLASKYLHFHKPDMFYIYDSRASTALSLLVKKDRHLIKQFIAKGRDDAYTVFCIRAIQLRNYINVEFGHFLTPRELDNYLLFFSDNKSQYVP